MKDSFMSSPGTASGTSPALAERDDEASIHANLTERFEMLKFVGVIGSSYCFVARDLAARNRGSDLVRLKVLSDDAAVDPEQRRLFYLEAAAAAKLSHRNITRTTEAEDLGGVHFYTVEHSATAGSLRGLLDIRSWLEIDVAVSIALQVADALDHAHKQGVLHLNLKPENILIEPEGRVLITEFGIDSEGDLAWAHVARSGNHSPRYSSPEQNQGSGIDCRSDLYSFGIVLFEMLTDRVPFDSADESLIKKKQLTQASHPPQLFRQGISNYLSALVLTLLEKNPDWRFKTAEQLRTALRKVERGDFEGGAPASISVFEIPTPPEQRAFGEDQIHEEPQIHEETQIHEEAENHEEAEYHEEPQDSEEVSVYRVEPEQPEVEEGPSESLSESVEEQIQEDQKILEYQSAETAEDFSASREIFEPPTIIKIDPPPRRSIELSARVAVPAGISAARTNLQPASLHEPPARTQKRRQALLYIWIMIVFLSVLYLLGRQILPGHFLTAETDQQGNPQYSLAAAPDANPPDATAGADQPDSTQPTDSAQQTESGEQTAFTEPQDGSSEPTASATAAAAGSIPTTSTASPPRRSYSRRSASTRVRQPARRRLQAKRRVRRPRSFRHARVRSQDLYNTERETGQPATNRRA